jgi:Holliday junction resolvase RusA-like endonuclease
VTSYKLPVPPSGNELVRPVIMGRNGRRPVVRLVSTREADDFRREAHRRLPIAPIAGPVEVFATFYLERISADVDNRLKALLDATKGRLVFDDKQVAEIHAVKVITNDPNEVGCVLTVVPANPADHPELSKRLAKSSIQERANEAAQAPLLQVSPNFKPGVR